MTIVKATGPSKEELESGDFRFFFTSICWEDEKEEDVEHREYLFCADNDETCLLPSDPVEDDDIFYYALGYKEALSMVGKETSETNYEFKILSVTPPVLA